jgi:predicted nucleotidyltransferase component of viral defense system
MRIKQKEIQEIAERFGVPANTIDKDYVLGHFLNELFQRVWAKNNFLFKGGTCLKKCYFDHYRFSEDIDITVINKAFILKKADIQQVCNAIFEKTGIAFKILKFEEVPSQDIFMGWDCKICFWGANHLQSSRPVFGKDCHTFIELEIRIHEKIIFDSEIRKLIHPYSDNGGISVMIPCYSIHEILAEKMRSLIQRNRGEARDYYDLWYIKNSVAEINWQLVKQAFLEKCNFKNIAFTGVNDFFKESRLKQVESTWHGRLSHQLPKSMRIDMKTAIEELIDFFNKFL